MADLTGADAAVANAERSLKFGTGDEVSLKLIRYVKTGQYTNLTPVLIENWNFGDILRGAAAACARAALRPGGVLAVWSSAPSKPFAKRLDEAGFVVDEVIARATRKGGARHVIWFATKA